MKCIKSISRKHRRLTAQISLSALVLCGLLLLLPTAVCGAATHDRAVITAAGLNTYALTDGNYTTYTTADADTVVTVSRTDGIQGIYIVFDRIPFPWLLTDTATGAQAACGTNGFLHEYVDVAALFGASVTSCDLIFPTGTSIADIYVFSDGELPTWVQRWNPPTEEADLLLFTSHSDDEQLFFAGLLPLYAGEMGYNVQVAYVVQHYEAYGAPDHQRPHEQLNGLWAVGVTNYPVMSDFPDLYSESLEGALSVYGSVGVTEEMVVAYMTETIRRFRPLVVVSHDPKGEYSHGTHILCTHALKKALEISDNSGAFPESAAQYGTWKPEKVYLHLLPENPIVMNYDVPLSRFDGKTAFEVTQYGFSFHKSQHWTWFYDWIYGTDDAPITKATEVRGYSPCQYGLYFTSVGYDVTGGDMFENVKTYAVRHTEEEAARAETEAPETAPPETTPSEETNKADTESEPISGETDAPEAPSAPQSVLPLIFVGILCIAVAAVLIIYIVTLGNLKHKKKRR